MLNFSKNVALKQAKSNIERKGIMHIKLYKFADYKLLQKRAIWFICL